MKTLLRSIVSLFTVMAVTSAMAVTPTAIAPPSGYVGIYEALLYETDEATGTPAGFITLTTVATGKFTGKLTTDENKVYPFTGGFTYNAETDLATTFPSALISISRGTVLPALSLSLSISNNGQTFAATVTANGLPNRVATTGVKITPRAKTSTDVWPGKYTLAFAPSGVVAVGPSGSSYAAGIVDAAGTLKLAGKLADGTLLTATLLPDANRGYRTYLNVLKRPGSFFAGKINLVARTVGTGFHVVTATSPARDFVWKKPAFTADKTYPTGFGPLSLLLTMEPWTLPGKGQTLAAALGTANFQFDFNFNGAGIDTSKYVGLLPKKLTITATNQLLPVFGDELAPTTAALWAKIWTGKVDPLTGIYSGTLTLEDLVDPDGAGNKPAAIIKRKVTFQGVIFNVLDALKPLAAGNFTLPPINVKTETIQWGSTVLGDALEALGLGAPLPNAIYDGVPGNYTFLLDTAPSDSTRDNEPDSGVIYSRFMTGLPAAGSLANVSIAPSLGTVTLNGKVLPLIADARPTALLYGNIFASPFNHSLVTVNLHPITGRVTSFHVRFDQVITARFVALNRSLPTPAIAIYLNNTALTKTK
jgi:hypothetical protein